MPHFLPRHAPAARWVLTNESVVTFNHAYLLGKVVSN